MLNNKFYNLKNKKISRESTGKMFCTSLGASQTRGLASDFKPCYIKLKWRKELNNSWICMLKFPHPKLFSAVNEGLAIGTTKLTRKQCSKFDRQICHTLLTPIKISRKQNKQSYLAFTISNKIFSIAGMII